MGYRHPLPFVLFVLICTAQEISLIFFSKQILVAEYDLVFTKCPAHDLPCNSITYIGIKCRGWRSPLECYWCLSHLYQNQTGDIPTIFLSSCITSCIILSSTSAITGRHLLRITGVPKRQEEMSVCCRLLSFWISVWSITLTTRLEFAPFMFWIVRLVSITGVERNFVSILISSSISEKQMSKI